MCASSPGFDQGVPNNSGIVPGHAYSLLAGKIIKDRRGKDQKLVQLRNPWKFGEWNGKFSDKSKEWYPALKKELDYVDSDDGIFWMPYEDLKKEFEEVEYMAHNDVSHTRTDLENRGDGNDIQMRSRLRGVILPLLIDLNDQDRIQNQSNTEPR